MARAMTSKRIATAALLLGLTASIVACGGGGGSPTTTPTPRPTAARETPLAVGSPTFNPDIRTTLESAYFVNGHVGWVGGISAGGQSLILATTDGGATWEQQLVDSSGDVTQLQFVSPSTGWALVRTNVYKWSILRTTSGGETWEHIYSSMEPIESLQFIDEEQGRAILRYPDKFHVVASRDGGRRWTTISVLPKSTSIPSLCFNDAEDGWLAEDRSVMHTSDSGKTWETRFVTPPSTDDSLPLFGISELKCAGVSITWALAQGPVGGGSDNTTLFRTTDDGTTWDKVRSDVNFGFVSPVASHTAVFVSSCGPCQKDLNVRLATTNDVGTSWADAAVPTLSQVNAGFFVTPLQGWLVGPAYGTTKWLILATTDGGKTWTQQYP